MSTEQRLIDLEATVEKMLADAKNIGALPILTHSIAIQDKFALRITASGQTVGATMEELITGGVGDNSVNHPVMIPFDFPLNKKTDLDSLHGGLHATGSQSGIVLNSGQTITDTIGLTRILLVVNAGSDLVGEITITGTSVDRDTGAESGSATDVIPINGLTTDGSTTDGNGNTIHSFTNAYRSGKWFKGAITLSTTDVNLTDIDVYQIAYEQFNDTDNITIDTIDTTYLTTNTGAIMDAYLYSIECVGNVASLTLLATLTHETGQSANFYRKRISDITKEINGAADGIFIDLFLNPSSQEYFSSFTCKVWGVVSETVTVLINGSLALDEITYGETLADGNLAYLKPADGKYWKADNTAETTSTTELRLILENGVADDVKLALAKGQYVATGMTAGLEYVGTSGTITSSRPTSASEVSRIVSTAISTTIRYFCPSKTWIAGDLSKVNGVSLPGFTNEFLDSVFRIKNVDNQTKKIAFDASQIAPNTTRTPIIQDADGVLAYLSDIQASNLNWQVPIIDEHDFTTPPVAPSTDDRYLNTVTDGAYTENYIYEWDGGAWVEEIPTTNWAVYNETTFENKIFNGTEWVQFSGNFIHNSLLGLQGGAANDYYHLTLAQLNDLLVNPQKEVDDTYTVVAGDSKYTIFLNKATAFNVTIDTIAVANFECDFINIGAGTVTFVDGTANLNYPDGLVLAPNRVCALMKFLNNNEYWLKGELV